MKAIAWKRYGPPATALEIIETERPVPKDDELQVRVLASSVTSGDSRIRALRVPFGFGLLTRLGVGLTRPRANVPGMSFSGEVEAVGSAVKDFKVGDPVYGSAGMRMGAHAEVLCLSEKAAVSRKPGNVDHTGAAASVFGGQTAIYFLKDRAGLKAGQRILINGASGSVGTAAVQLAKHLGVEVVAICSTANVDLVTSLGADRVIDYTQQLIEDEKDTFDFIVDTVGNLPLARCRHLLGEKGRLIAISTGLWPTLSSIWNRRLICGVATESKTQLELLATLIEEGRIEPVIDGVYPLDQIVSAHERVDGGHKRGNVVITMVEDTR
jgi:NADPH:quinone reductase-like Zn-dependent oxidoreductase